MKRFFLGLVVILVVLISASVASAASGGPVQGIGQWAGASQTAASASTATQQQPTNTADPVSVLSPGSNGAVAQSNSVGSDSSATNRNSSDQNASQFLAGLACGCAADAGLQAIGQTGAAGQAGAALSGAQQSGADNTASTGAPTSGPAVNQSNSAGSSADASNGNSTTQAASQDPSAGADQVVGQVGESEQTAVAGSQATQTDPQNNAVSVRVLSPGNDGSTTQSNHVDSDARASNHNSLDQSADQTAASAPCGCSGSGTTQAVGQSASSEQGALAGSQATQTDPQNNAISVRVLSPGNGGSTNQSNSAGSSADASNGNSTTQAASQDPSAGADQVVGQVGESEQTAVAGSQATQTDPQNNAVSVRVLSPGNDGSTTQSNHVDSDARASNHNSLDQSADQTAASAPCGCSGSGTTQAVGQSASSEQGALAGSQATQTDPQNNAISVRVLSPGNGGSTNQSNSAGSSADASNGNSTTQAASQDPSAGADQVVGQVGESEQTAVAGSQATQTDPQNNAVSVRVLSPGNDGSTTQSNHVDSDARASNHNSLDQSADQTAASAPCGCSGSGTTQAVGQSASSEQGALAGSQATQTDPQNNAISVRVLSPGNGGSTNQSNSAGSSADASNGNSTTQAASQDPSAGADQVVGQVGESEQTAVAGSQATQTDPQNNAVSVRVLSPGNDGSTTQSNHVDSDARASNHNSLDQSADQTAASAPCGCSGSGTTQAVGQSASSEQGALAGSQATQTDPQNNAISVRVLSPGNGGSTNQSNSAGSSADASNGNSTTQAASQDPSAGADQVVGQVGESEQTAVAGSQATQTDPQNNAVSVRVLSPGNDGSTTQSNHVDSDARASNHNSLDQSADQTAASAPCGCSGSGTTQAVGQSASSEQGALAGSQATQTDPQNNAISVRVLSPGNGGSTNQSNSAGSSADASNGNSTTQAASQDPSAGADQVVGQVGESEQTAVAGSQATQTDPQNNAVSVRVLSPGNDGSTTQSNHVDSDARASNHNSLDQSADQTAASAPCGCSGSGTTQAVGQSASSEQGALAGSQATQDGASNTADPVRVGSAGSDGSVHQSNRADSDANATNGNWTGQTADQSSAARCGCGGLGIQALGQSASSWQAAVGLSGAIQDGASNDASPTRVLSPGTGGSTTQSNSVDSNARSSNWNGATQDASQDPSSGIQALGQEASSTQFTLAGSLAAQLPAERRCGCSGASGNTADPVRVGSAGSDGSVHQSNRADSDANATNGNWTGQTADQSSAARCGCGGLGIQALGQSASSWQAAVGLSGAIQDGASNDASPTRVLSPGTGGSTTQSNSVDSNARSSNWNKLLQLAGQFAG